jgi:hypothetical protein
MYTIRSNMTHLCIVVKLFKLLVSNVNMTRATDVKLNTKDYYLTIKSNKNVAL